MDAFKICLEIKEKNLSTVFLPRLYAELKHGKQVRKFSNAPYIEHLDNVASWFWENLGDEHKFQPTEEELFLTTVAYLHDTLEDTDATKEEIETLFGKEVLDAVVMLTDVSKPSDGNRAVRKAIDREHLSKASDMAKLVKIADLYDNAHSIPEDHPFFAVFAEEAKALLEVINLPDVSDLAYNWLIHKATKTMLNIGKCISCEQTRFLGYYYDNICKKCGNLIRCGDAKMPGEEASKEPDTKDPSYYMKDPATWREMITWAMEKHNETWTNVEHCTLSQEELDVVFDSGYGGVEGKPFTVWTSNRVYFPSEYDGAEGVKSVSRVVNHLPTEHV